MASNQYGSITSVKFTKAFMPGVGWAGFVTFDASLTTNPDANTTNYFVGFRVFFADDTFDSLDDFVWPFNPFNNFFPPTDNGGDAYYNFDLDTMSVASSTARSFPPTTSVNPLSYQNGVFINENDNTLYTINGILDLQKGRTNQEIEQLILDGATARVRLYGYSVILGQPTVISGSTMLPGIITTDVADVSEGHSSPVVDLAVTGSTATSISFSWSAPRVYSGTLTNYNIYHRPAGTLVPYTVTTVSSLTTSHSLSGLNSSTNYEVMVKAVTSTGESAHQNQFQGNFIASTTAITIPAKPAAPTVVRQAEPGALTVSWVEPNNGGSAILDYNVEISTDALLWTPITTTANLSLSVTNLNTAPTYYFRVKARNSVGFSDPSDASVGITTGALPGAPGTPVPGTQVVINSVPLTWSAAAANGFAITRYDVEYSTPYISGDDPVVVAANTGLSYTVLGLTNAVYVFRVRAVNEFGNGPWSGYSIEATPTGLPSPPTITEAVQFSSDVDNAVVKIRIQEPAADGGLDITNYRLEFTYVNPSNNDWEDPQYPFVQSVTQEEQVLPWYQTSHMFAHPDYGTVTQVWYRVAAINPNGTGDYSAVVGPIAITPTPVIDPAILPTVVTDFTLTPKEGKLVLVWNAPANPGAGSTVNELLYQIQYSADGVNWTSVPYP